MKPSAQLATRIEEYLLANPRWVHVAELCRVFDLGDGRALRADKTNPGLLSKFAISSSGHGFKHIRHATDAEFSQAYRRMRSHGLGELMHARRLRRARERAIASHSSHSSQTSHPAIERATGQALLPTILQ